MPQPYKPPSGNVHFSPNILRSRVRCAVAMASVANASANLEQTLARLIGLASSSELQLVHLGGNSGVTGMPNRVAEAALGQINDYGLKVRVVRAVLEVSVTAELLAEFDELSREIFSAVRRRNTIIHTAWGICDERPDDLLQSKPDGNGYLLWTPDELEDVERAFGALTLALFMFASRCGQHRATLVEAPLGPSIPDA